MAIASTPITEVWMEVIDSKRLAKLLLIQGISQRQLSSDIGWKSHTYIARLIKGQAKTVSPDSAARIAHRLGVGIDDLFLVKSSGTAGSSAHQARKSA